MTRFHFRRKLKGWRPITGVILLYERGKDYFHRSKNKKRDRDNSVIMPQDATDIAPDAQTAPSEPTQPLSRSTTPTPTQPQPPGSQTLPPTLATLPPELKTMLLKAMHPITSLCLALACKPYYPLHLSLYGLAPTNPLLRFHKPSWFFERYSVFAARIDPREERPPGDVGDLGELLQEWMGGEKVLGIYNLWVGRETHERDLRELDAQEERRRGMGVGFARG